MKGRVIAAENGQTLIMIALALVVLIGFLALAVDVGHTYAERRKMQNAADAGALAGAWELCFGDPAQALVTAEYYAEDLNGAQEALVDYIPNDWTVNVTATETIDTFFAGVIGFPTMDVGAAAAAACGAADSAYGLWPIAYPQDDFDNYVANCPRHMYVWAGNQEDGNPDCGPTEDHCDCDVNGDDMNDIVDFYGRAWLSLTQFEDPQYVGTCPVDSWCNAPELACWIKGDGGRVTIPEDGLCIPGKPGVTWSRGVRDGVEEVADRPPPGNVVGMPLYDSMECDLDVDPCGGGTKYRVTGFGCITVLGINNDDDLLLWFQGEDHETVAPKCWRGKVIEVLVDCNQTCSTLCGGTSGAPVPDGGVGAVSLIK